MEPAGRGHVQAAEARHPPHFLSSRSDRGDIADGIWETATSARALHHCADELRIPSYEGFGSVSLQNCSVGDSVLVPG